MISTVDHVKDLLEIITTNDIPDANPCKDYASIYLKNYVAGVLK